jgi:hypothetical protein
VEKKSGAAKVTAEIKKSNRIEIHSHEVKKIRLHLRQEMFSEPGPIRVFWNGKQVYKGRVQDACSVTAPRNPDDPKLDLTDNKELSQP